MLFLVVFFFTYLSMTIAKGKMQLDSNTNNVSLLKISNIINKEYINNVTKDILKSILVPTIIQQIEMLRVERPPKRLSVPRNIKHGTTQEVRDNLVFSLVSYCPAKRIFGISCLCDESFSHVNIITEGDSDASVTIAVEKKAKLIIISYRASATIQNYITNFEYQMIDLPNSKEGVKVHQGFYVNYLANYFKAREIVTTLLKDPKYKDFTLHITGYSLGAPVATISLGDWKSLLVSLNDTRKIQAYVYGSPRPGNENFAQFIASLNISATRYCHGNDLFSQLPPRSLNYVHAIPEIYEIKGKDGKSTLIECSQEYDEDPNCGYTESGFSILDHIFFFGSFIRAPPYCYK